MTVNNHGQGTICVSNEWRKGSQLTVQWKSVESVKVTIPILTVFTLFKSWTKVEIKYDKVQNLSHEGRGDTFLLLRAAVKDPEYLHSHGNLKIFLF